MKFLNQPIYKNMIMCYNILGYKYSILFKQFNLYKCFKAHMMPSS